MFLPVFNCDLIEIHNVQNIAEESAFQPFWIFWAYLSFMIAILDTYCMTKIVHKYQKTIMPQLCNYVINDRIFISLNRENRIATYRMPCMLIVVKARHHYVS